jgi:hypothetical protein
MYRRFDIPKSLPLRQAAGRRIWKGQLFMDDTEFLNNYFVSICYLKKI